MSEAFIVAVSLIVPLAIAVFLFVTLIRSIMKERRAPNVEGIWVDFGLSLTFAGLFLISWLAQWVAEWQVYSGEQQLHGEPTAFSDFIVYLAQSTLENWQSEFLQLFSFVVLAALMIHRGSAESKDSDERMEELLKTIAKDVEDLKAERGSRP